MTNFEIENSLRQKASEYILENDLIIAAPKAKIVTYLPVLKNQDFFDTKYPKININVQDLLDINTSDNQTILDFYNKYGDLGLLSELITKFINPPVWLKILNSNENFLGIYQPIEQLRNSVWRQQLDPLTMIPVKFPKSTFNSKLNSIPTNEEVSKYTQIKPKNTSIVYNSKLVDLIETIETKSLSEMQQFFPSIKSSLSKTQNQTVYPTPYSKIYFKYYAENLNTVKFVIKEIKSLIKNFAKFGENISEYYQESKDPIEHDRIKLRQIILNSQPEEKIIPTNILNTNEKKWQKLLLFNSLISMFTHEVKEQSLLKNWKLCTKLTCQKPFIPKTKTQNLCSNSCKNKN